MIRAFHFILSAYGFWLPNDPRGSWSEVIRQYELLRFGPATKINGTQSVAHLPHDASLRRAAKQALKYPPVRFTGIQARAIAYGFATAAAEAGYVIHALAILRDHVHLVMAYHPRDIDEIAAHLKAKATACLTCEGLHPMARFTSDKGRVPSPWARNYWCPFIDSDEQLFTAIEYVEMNPIKAGLKPQRWRNVVPVGSDPWKTR